MDGRIKKEHADPNYTKFGWDSDEQSLTTAFHQRFDKENPTIRDRERATPPLAALQHHKRMNKVYADPNYMKFGSDSDELRLKTAFYQRSDKKNPTIH